MPFVSLALSFTSPAATDAPLCITELMALNDTTLQDEDGDCSDWIELCNRSDAPWKQTAGR